MKCVLVLLLCSLLIPSEVHCVRFDADPSLPIDDGAAFAFDGKIWTETGNEAIDRQFPWQVSIGLLNPNSSITPFCSGALISPDWVLTAAKCVLGVGNLELKFGSINRTFYDQIQLSNTYTIHPSYSEKTLGGEKMSIHNIALVKLEKSVILSDKVSPIGVSDTKVFTAFARFAGWGTTRSTTATGTLSPTLNYVNMVVLTNAACQLSFKSAIESVHMCTSGSQPRKTGTCDGDTGGALSVFRDDNWYVIGIAFIASDTCKTATPGPSVYTRVSSYYAWIEDTTRLNLTLEGTTVPSFTTTTDPGSAGPRTQSLGWVCLVAFHIVALLVTGWN